MEEKRHDISSPHVISTLIHNYDLRQSSLLKFLQKKKKNCMKEIIRRISPDGEKRRVREMLNNPNVPQ